MPLRHQLNTLVLIALGIGASVCRAAELPVFSAGRCLLCLDVDADFLVAQRLEAPVADLERCFQQMTGAPLPNTTKRIALFDPATPAGLRVEATVRSMEDLSANSSENGMVELTLTPTQRLERGPLAGPGEKVVWNCVWQRGAGRLQFSLTVAKDPYYGPGYGPFTFKTLEADVPAQVPTVQLALELRHAGGQDVRGGYRLGTGEWQYTDWFDPTKAGTDTREPGASDKNGAQAWGADWPARWAGKTAADVSGYGAMNRQVRIRLDDVAIRSGERALFEDHFEGAEGRTASALSQWRMGPQQGQATIQQGAALLEPASDAWNTVGLVAATAPAAAPAGAIPLRLKLLDRPANASRLDPQFTQGWRMDATAQGIDLGAYTRLGLQNAIYALLDRWGCRWVMVGDLGECIPRVQKLTVPTGTLQPKVYNDFSIDPSGSGTPYAEFYARNQAGYLTWTTMQHYWLYAIPPEKHFAAHPEWYSLIAGQRQARQLCTSNPEVVAEMIRVAKEFLRGGQDRLCFPMDPMDCSDFCECDNCRALDVRGQFTNGAPTVTDRVLHFVNQVAAGIQEEFPDRYVGFYAYWSHLAPPLREKPAPNVLVGITRMNNCLLHLTPTPVCAMSDFHALVRQWQKLTPNVYSYEYDPISWTGGLPCPTWLDMGRSLHTMLVDMGVKGSYSDYGVLPAAHAATFLNRYLPLRMKVNPQQRPEDVLHDVCRVFFGPAAAPMEQHYLEMAKVTEHAHPGIGAIGVGTTYYHLLFAPDQIKRARGCLDKAAAAAKGKGIYEQRVAMVDLSQQYLEGYLQGVWAAQAKDYGKSEAAFDRMDRALTALIEHKWADVGDAPARAKVMRLKALAEHFPERFGYVTRWKLLGPFDNSDRAADQRPGPDETAIVQGGVSAKADGTPAAPWWDYQSPGGFLNLEKALAPKQGDWTISYCYAATTYDAPRDMAAQLKMDSFFPFRVFLNGAEVFYRPGLNADCPDRQTVDVRLRQGPNLIVIKLCQTQVTTDSFPWGLYFRVVADDAPEAVVLPERWRFKTDPKDEGVGASWFASDCDDSSWQRIRVGQTWESEIGPYDGDGWYRVKFALPAQLPPKLALQFGGVDEEAWVYLNGQLIGERTTQSTGRTVGEIWEEPFSLPVPADALRPGQENVLAVRVHDSAFAGGLYRTVKLVVVP